MSDGLPITGVGPAPSVNTPTGPAETVAESTTANVYKDVTPALTDIQVSTMVNNTMETYITNCLKAVNLPRTEENYNKIAINLTKKLEGWLVEGDGLLDDVDVKDYSKHFLDSACARMGIPSTTDNWARVLKTINKVK